MPALALAALCLATAPAAYLTTAPAAWAKPVDVRSDRVALGDYRQLLSTLVSQRSARTQAAEGYIAMVSSGCPNVLGSLGTATSVNADALNSLGTEGGLDLLTAAHVPDRAAVTTFASRVSRLRWSRHKSTLTVRRYVATMHAVYWMAPSDLCGDANSLVASGGQTTPAATAALIAAIAKANTASRAASAATQKLFNRFATGADGSVIKSINKLVGRLNSDETAFVHSEIGKLLTTLGFPG